MKRRLTRLLPVVIALALLLQTTALANANIYHMSISLTNNSDEPVTVENLTVTLYDRSGRVLARRLTYDGTAASFLTIAPHAALTKTVDVALPEGVSGADVARSESRATAAVLRYRYLYNIADGRHDEPIASGTLTAGSALERIADPVLAGYTFLGWFADAACTEKYDFSLVPGEDTTLYAGWSGAQGRETGTELPFTDVSPDDFCYNAVAWAVKNGVTTGVDATHFAPDAGTVRAQVVTLLWRAAGCPEPTGGARGFADVPEDAYYTRAVAWAAEAGVTTGVDETHFAPDAVCTRGQIVTLLARFAGAEEDTPGVRGFADVPENAYYARAVAWAVKNGVTAGVDATHFAPDAVCTRAQVVTFLYRCMTRE